MKICQINIKNINSLQGEVSLNFEQEPLRSAGLFAITGDTGAGKTTILDAITLALYGKIHRNKEVAEVLTYAQTDAIAEVIFEVKNEKYLAQFTMRRARKKIDGNIIVERSLSHFNKQKSEYESLTQNKSEVNEHVEAISGLDAERFMKSVLLSQGDFAAFLKAKENEKSDLLESITGTAIYSDLSKIAFQRHREENELLKEKQATLQHITLLSKEELEVLRAQIAENEKNTTSLKTEKQTTEKQIEQIHLYEKLLTEKDQLHVEKEKIDTQKVEIDIFQNQVKAHHLAMPFLGDLQIWQKESDDLDDLGLQINDNQTLINNILEKNIIAQNNFDIDKKLLNDFEKKKKEKNPIWEEAIKYQIQLEPLQTFFQEINKKQKAEQKEFDKNSEKLKNYNNEIVANRAKKESLKNWLSENLIYQTLPTELVKIDEKRNQLKEIYIKQQENNKAIVIAEKLKNEQTINVEKLAKKLKDNQLELEKWQTELAKIGCESAERQTFRTDLNTQIENTQQQASNLEALYKLSNEYRETLKKLNAYEQHVENLQVADIYVHKDILTSLEILDEIRYKYEAKKQTVELFAEFEKLRNDLSEGDECPICGSKAHPFRAHDFKFKNLQPSLELEKSELKNITSQLKEVEDNHRRLIRQQDDLKSEIANYIHETEEKIENIVQSVVFEGQKIKDENTKLSKYEREIVKIKHALEDHTFKNTNLDYLKQSAADAQAELKRLKVQRADFEQIITRLTAAEITSNQLKIEELNAKNQLSNATETLKNAQATAENFDSDFSTIVILLDDLLKPFGKKFTIETAKDTFALLEKNNTEFQAQNQLLTQIEESINRSEGELNGLQEIEKKLAQNLANIKMESEVKQQEINILIENIKNLVGEQNPIQLRSALEEKIQNQTKIIAQKTEILNQIQNEKIAAETTQKSLIQNFIQIKNSFEKNNLRIEKNLTKTSFENIETLKNAILKSDFLNNLEQKIKDFEAKIIQNQQNQTKNEQELSQIIAQKNDDSNELSVASLTSKIKESEAQITKFQQEIGAINERINQDQKLRNQSRFILQDIEKQQLIVNRLARISDLIGSADGKKFRVFVQSLTLRQLVALANQHLQKLSGRYIIDKAEGDVLNLDIIDTWHADNRRSMNTLSGGESFLASLALALGLSDMAGKNTQIKSLFIDEGFGTLDENTLDLAIATLENLQSQGKTIGIISHVKELKERIGTQVQIKKRGNGYSRVEVV